MPSILARVSEFSYMAEEVGWKNKSQDICNYIRNSTPEDFPDVVSIVDDSSPNVSQVTDRLMRYAFYEEHAPQLRSSRTTIVSNEDTWLSYKDAISDNINAPKKSQFENAYARELSRLESVGTWDATAPSPAHSLAPEAIIDTNFEFNTNSNGEKCCRVVQEGVS